MQKIQRVKSRKYNKDTLYDTRILVFELRIKTIVEKLFKDF